MPGMNQGDNLEEIYAWIDELSFSKPKKNISRDFSDGVLMAEIFRIHYPRLTDVHNYIPANNIAGKKENWNTLNRKVFSKIDMKLSKEVIDQLANAQPGAIEKVLLDLRNKIFTKDSSAVKENPIKIQSHDNFLDNQNGNNAELKIVQKDETSSLEVLDSAVVKISKSNLPVTKSTRNFIGKACNWVVSWMWPFSEPTKIAQKESSSPSAISTSLERLESTEQEVTSKTIEDEDEEASGISRIDFLRLRQEVQEKNLAIIMLNRKVSRLESAMKLKDRKIGNLAAQISSPSTETAQNFRPHVIGSSISRLRYQTKNCTKSIS